MLRYIIVFCAGLIVAWNLYSQPQWVADAYHKFEQSIKK